MNKLDQHIITTRCGRKFDKDFLAIISISRIDHNFNDYYTVFISPDKEYIRSRSLYDSQADELKTSYEVISEQEALSYVKLATPA
jgi:hypothetical protein